MVKSVKVKADTRRMNSMTQNEMILKHLEEYGKITTFEAFKYYGITRLAARIFDLRQLGYKFVVSKHRSGKGKPYAVYELFKED